MFINHESKPFPSEESLLNVISGEEIFVKYLGGIPRKLISSPFRKDKIPSFGLFMSSRYGKIFFKDFATGDSGDCFVFVKKLFNLERITDAYNRIAHDFNLDEFYTNLNSVTFKKTNNNLSKTAKALERDVVKISVKIRKFNINDSVFWKEKYFIGSTMLKHCHVYPISHYFLNNYCVKADKLAYAFVENKDGNPSYKIYQPFSENKWINNNDNSVWELWRQLPIKGENLIITSSRKDAMVIKSLFNENYITSCSLQAEGIMPKESAIENLVSRFKNIFILYDNDLGKEKNWGRINGEKICNKFKELKQIEIPSEYNLKDISDYIEVKKEDITRELILKLIEKKT